MTKPRKLHQLTGTINHCFLGQVSSQGPHQKQPFYCLIITQPSFFSPTKETIYAFPNLVSQELWNTLEQQAYQGKKYLFWCEKRVRGWRLKDWQELS